MQLVGQGGVIIEAGPQPGQPGYENYGYQQGYNNSVSYQENVTVVQGGGYGGGGFPQQNVIVEENYNVENVVVVEDNNSFGAPNVIVV